MVITEFGIVTVVSKLLVNAPPPMSVIEFGMLTAVRCRLSNAAIPIEVTAVPPLVEGIVMLIPSQASAVHPITFDGSVGSKSNVPEYAAA